MRCAETYYVIAYNLTDCFLRQNKIFGFVYQMDSRYFDRLTQQALFFNADRIGVFIILDLQGLTV